MGENYQMYRAAVKAAKGVRQLQKADREAEKDKADAALRHFDKALDCFASSLEHLEKAEDDVCAAAANEVAKGNDEAQKSLEAFQKGDMDAFAKHYEHALDSYDSALDKLDS